MIFLIALCVLSFLLLATLVLFFTSRGVFIKIQIANTFGTLIVITIAVYCYKINKPQYIDIALLYALLNYISIIAFRRYFNLSLLREQAGVVTKVARNSKESM